MKRYLYGFALCMAFSLVPGMAGASGAQDADKDADSVAVYIGELKRIPANTPTRVVIGNPSVADIFSVDTKEIVVAGKGAGMTNLLWWDGAGERSMRIKVLTEEMAYCKSRIDDLMKQMGYVNVVAKPADAEGKVLLLGSVKTTADLNQIKTALGDMSKKIINLIAVDEEESTVELDVEVIEVDQDGRKQLGIEWPSSLELSEPDDFVKTLAKTPSSLVQISKWTHGTLTTKLDFLEQEGKARILSRPRLACQSGKEAELLVGGETPIMTTQVTGNSSGSGTEVEYKEYGIKLKIAPVIMADAKVKLSISVEVSDVGETALKLGSSDAPTAIAYPLSKRNTSTQLVLNNNQTLAISGLIKQQMSEDVTKVPFLGDLPLIGLMFRHRDTKYGKSAGSRGNTELVIMVTPKILKNGKEPVLASVNNNSPAAAQALKPLPEPVAQSAVSSAALLTLSEGAKKSDGGSLDGYVRRIAEYISGKIEYPSLAKMSGIEGTVKLSLHVTRTGELLETSVSKSSGHAVLDADALNTAREISPYPGFPKGISDKDLWIQVPISYRLTANK